MANKTMKTRIINKHDTEANWKKAENFIPEKGELIVYDIDGAFSYERLKVGDGKSTVNELPFAASRGIIDAVELPELGDKNAIYRTEVKAAWTLYGKEKNMLDGSTVPVKSVGRLPSSVPAFSLRGDIDTSPIYFQNSDNKAYVYTGPSDGWLELGVAIAYMLGAADGFGGYITPGQVANYIDDPRIFFVVDDSELETKLYQYNDKNGWVDLIDTDKPDYFSLYEADLTYASVQEALLAFKTGKKVVYQPSAGNWHSSELVAASKVTGDIFNGIFKLIAFGTSYTDPYLTIITADGSTEEVTVEHFNLSSLSEEEVQNLISTSSVNFVKSNTTGTYNTNYPVAVMSTNDPGTGDALYKDKTGLTYNPSTKTFTMNGAIISYNSDTNTVTFS